MDIQEYMSTFRSYISGADTKVPLADGRMTKAINFDNAATTPPFIPVLNEIMNFAPWYSSVHRGTGYKSKLCSKVFENSRLKTLKFVNGNLEKDTVIYVKNTTEAINKLSYRFCENYKRCIILSTGMEHHSNDLPWRNKFKIDYISVDDAGRLRIDDLEQKLIEYGGYVRLVTVAGASNVTGLVNPIHQIASLVHKYGAMICVDGAQIVPHMKVEMKGVREDESIDFLAFSAHKMYAPFGTGVLIGPKRFFEKGQPDYVGGGTVKIVTPDYVKWDAPPHNEEAGSPNLMGIVALNAAIDTLNYIGIDNIHKYETFLTGYAIKRMSEIHELKIYGGVNASEKVGIIPFNISGMHHSKVAEELSDKAGIAVRNGCFCAQPYIQKLLKVTEDDMETFIENPDKIRPGMVRVSFGLYNNVNEIDRLVSALKFIVKNKDKRAHSVAE